jgi:Beta-propeller repeat
MYKDFLRAIVLCSAALSPSLLAAAPNAASSASGHFDRPVVFEPNLGQAPSQFSWTARGAGYEVYLSGSGASIVLAEPVAVSPANAIPSIPGRASDGIAASRTARLTLVGMNLGGSHAWSHVQGLEPTGGVSNYMVGQDSKNWHSGIPQYGRLQVKDVYDGIDLVFYGHGHDLEYDFVVKPGGDPNQIRLTFDGAMRVDEKTGDLVIKTRTGSEMRHVRPRVYQQVGNQKVEVAGAYQLMANGEAAFRLASYDRRSSLVVDPEVKFVVFLEGNAEDVTTGMAIDSAGNSYLTGQTFSTDFPVTAGSTSPVAKVCPGNVCPAYIFVTKISPAGVVLNSTLIGGSGTDVATAIAADSTGVWVTGKTNSQNFQTGNDIFGFGFWNGFIANLKPDLSLVNWCVLFGGGGDQYTEQIANAIAVDSHHNAYVAGDTYSDSFPTSENLTTPRAPKQKAAGGGADAFVVKVGPDGDMNSSGYATYLGGASDDKAYGIAVDSAGHAFVTGYTGSTNFPINGAKSHGSVANGGVVSFITELSKDGSSSVYSVMLGGTTAYDHSYPLDEGFAIAVDASDEAYVTGSTCTSDFPTNANSFQISPPSACLPQTLDQYFPSAFVAKLDCTGALLYSTYFGGAAGTVSGNSIAIDSMKNIYVGGTTSTGHIPGVTAIALNPTAGFVTKFHPKLYTIESSTFLGAAMTNIAESEPAPVKNVVPAITIYTAGYRYASLSPNRDLKYLDAYAVKLLFSPGP